MAWILLNSIVWFRVKYYGHVSVGRVSPFFRTFFRWGVLDSKKEHVGPPTSTSLLYSPMNSSTSTSLLHSLMNSSASEFYVWRTFPRTLTIPRCSAKPPTLSSKRCIERRKDMNHWKTWTVLFLMIVVNWNFTQSFLVESEHKKPLDNIVPFFIPHGEGV